MRPVLGAFASLIPLLLSFPHDSPVLADTFGSGDDAFEIEFVRIGQPGNPPDDTGQPNSAGAVPYEYRIAKYEVSERMIDAANALSAAAGSPLNITHDGRGPNKPATSIDWFEAARFVNWLNTSQGFTPAYKFVPGPGRPPTLVFALWEPGDPGYDPNNLFRNRLARYFLPSTDEWYKAAYYDPASQSYFDYPTGSNIPPIPVASGTAQGTAVIMQGAATGPADITDAGGLSPYGTMAQAGNASEWEETELDLFNDNTLAYRGGRAGWGASASSSSSSNRFGAFPQISGGAGGFRVAGVVPEPGAAIHLLMGVLAVLGSQRTLSVRQ